MVDTSQKRDRNRRKQEKRKEKESRRRDRADEKRQDPAAAPRSSGPLIPPPGYAEDMLNGPEPESPKK